MPKTILHLDMNSYFATAEQQLQPPLRGKPVGVIKAPGRTCVIAASVEAKKYGVKTGTTTWEAKKLCPQIIFVPSRMQEYWQMTQKLITLASSYSPALEVFSIDEMFLDITDTQTLYPGGALQMALEIKQRIKAELGEWMRASVGIAFSKITAKLASEMHKPDGLTFLCQDNYLSATNQIAVEEVCGIGFSRAKWLQTRGLYTLGQARAYPDLPSELADLVFLRTSDDLVTREDLAPAKSVSRSYTTYAVLSTQSAVLKLIRNLCEETALKLREMGMHSRTFSLSLSGEDVHFHTRKTISTPTDDAKIIFEQLTTTGQLPTGIRRAAVWTSNLIFNLQFTIFNKREKLFRAVDKVNAKFGGFTVYPAQLLGGELIRPEITGYLGDKWYRLNNAQ